MAVSPAFGVTDLTESRGAPAGDVDFSFGVVMIGCGDEEADLRLEARLVDLRSSDNEDSSKLPEGGLVLLLAEESLLRVSTFSSYGLKANLCSGDLFSVECIEEAEDEEEDLEMPPFTDGLRSLLVDEEFEPADEGFLERSNEESRDLELVVSAPIWLHV